MMPPMKSWLILGILLGGILVACSPRVQLPRTSVPLPDKFVNDTGNHTLSPLSDRWWEIFGLSELNRLVEKVLSANHDLRRARFRIEELADRLSVKRAERFPRLDLDFSGKRGRQTFVGSSSYPGWSGYLYGEFQGRLQASYEVDLWRRLSAGEAAARWEWLASVENREALAQSLVSETVSLYLQAAFTRCEIDLLRKERDLSRKRLTLLEERFRSGLLSVPEILSAREAYRALSATLPERERALGDLLQQLEVLSGEYPSGRWPLKAFSKACAVEIPSPPPGLPSELLRRRPDIREAEARLKAAAERVRLARAARFPRLVLTAEEGRVSNALSDLLSHRNRFWSLSFALTQPLFEAGKLAAEEKAAIAALRQAEAHYAQVVLQAFREVEFGLLSEEKLRRRLSETQGELQAVSLEATFCEKRFKEGLVGLPECLEKRIRVLQTQRKLLQARLALLLNRVFLFEALGGGFGGEKGEAP